MQQSHHFENNWYYVTEPKALEDLRIHGRDITYLIPFWFGVTEQGSLVDTSDAETVALIRQLGLPVLAIIHNYASRQYGPLIHRLLTTESLRRALVSNILNMLMAKRFFGVNIDFEFVPPEDRPFMTRFMAELYQTVKPYGFLVTISVPPELYDDPTHPFSGAFSYPDLSRYSDQVYVLAYDEHVAEPGPIASIGWVRRVMAYALSVMPRQKIRMGMAVYGRDWSPRTELPVELSYKEAVDLAVRYGATIRYDQEAQELTYTYVENGVRHIVWFEDVTSFSVKLNFALQESIPGIGVWRLGLEHQLIWNLLQRVLRL
ncbi:MAG: glycosyl hydrolase family 18 protein [Bacillota bacterium]